MGDGPIGRHGSLYSRRLPKPYCREDAQSYFKLAISSWVLWPNAQCLRFPRLVPTEAPPVMIVVPPSYPETQLPPGMTWPTLLLAAGSGTSRSSLCAACWMAVEGRWLPASQVEAAFPPSALQRTSCCSARILGGPSAPA